ncbi:hypothetical protein H0H93_014016, partial [Arthromyces matolae]
VETTMKKIQDLRPKDFDIKMLDAELSSMSMIRALPQDYSAFVLTLLLHDKLDKATVQQAFVTEEIQRQRRANDEAVASMAMAAALVKANAKQTPQQKRNNRGKKRQEQAHAASKDDNKSNTNDAEFAGNANVKKMLKNKLVVGMDLDSSAKPDPISAHLSH